MKIFAKFLCFTAFVTNTFTVCAQTAQTPPTLIQTCNGDRTQRVDLMNKTAIFRNAGINLNKYDWSNPDINCHINETIKQRTKSANQQWLASIVGGIGIGLISLSANDYFFIDEQRSLIGGGVVCLAGGVSLFAISLKSKKKSDQHFNQVAQYSREYKLYW